MSARITTAPKSHDHKNAEADRHGEQHSEHSADHFAVPSVAITAPPAGPSGFAERCSPTWASKGARMSRRFRKARCEWAERRLEQLDAVFRQSIRARDNRTNGERANRRYFASDFSSAKGFCHRKTYASSQSKCHLRRCIFIL
jgi:hypothetical protein